MPNPCIQRLHMPQVDHEHYPALFEFLGRLGVSAQPMTVLPHLCRARQCIRVPVKLVRETTLAKPVLVASDFTILDGNTRWATCLTCQRLMNVIRLGVPFDPALALLFAFPHTYSYGDGRKHPQKI